MRKIRSMAAMTLLAWLFVPAAVAGPNANARIMLNALSLTAKNHCTRTQNVPLGCSGYDSGVSNVPLYPTLRYVYALVVGGDQLSGVGQAAFGLNYQSPDFTIYDWHLCADSQAPTAGWPASGSGNVITFDAGTNCQQSGNALLGAVATLGYFYCAAYSPTEVKIRPHPVDRVARVWSCVGVEDVVWYDPVITCSALGSVGFARLGWNPCGDYSGCTPRGTCDVSGPPVAVSGDSTLVYSVSNYEGLTRAHDWTVTGNGEIVGSIGGPTVRVRAGAAGQFKVSFNVLFDPGAIAWSCSRAVTVEDNVPVTPTTWGGLKTLLR